MNEFILDGPAIVELLQRRSMSIEALASTIGVVPEHIEEVIAGRDKLDEVINDRLLALGAVLGAGERSLPITLPAEPEPVQEEPAPPREPSDTEPRRISNSEIQTFKRCRRKWWLAWHRGLKEREESPTGVRMIGNRIHRALEVGYAPGGPFHESIAIAHEGIVAHDRQLLGSVDEVTMSAFNDDTNLERIMLEGYVQWLEETGADSNLEVIGSEVYVEAPITPLSAYKRDIVIIGRLDVVVRVKSNDAIMFLDHKTVGSFGQITMMLPMNEQMRHYTLLQWMTNPGKRVDGAIFNMMRRVKRSARAKPPFYQREETRFNRHVIEDYYDRMLEEIDHMLELEASLDVLGEGHPAIPHVAYPSPNGACTWDCPFVKVCPMFDDGSRVEDAIAAHYEVTDPLSYYDKDKTEGDENDG